VRRFALTLLVALAADAFCFSIYAAQSAPYQAKVLPPTQRSRYVRILDGPKIERIESDWAIIRWTSTNPGGADEHFGVARYGTDPRQLSQVAKSHVRLNREHSTTVFRVMLTGLKPKTTYYYIVGSIGGDGSVDDVKSSESQFRTQ
jgi:phosphodiesterase/alkaline phosphatase D-like protein